MSEDNVNYEENLSDDHDTLDFGKFKGMSPNEIYDTGQAGRQYLIWAWTNTNRWVGSEDCIRDAFDAEKLDFKPRGSAISPKPVQQNLAPDVVAEQCHAAILDAYGVFPKPTWMY